MLRNCFRCGRSFEAKYNAKFCPFCRQDAKRERQRTYMKLWRQGHRKNRPILSPEELKKREKERQRLWYQRNKEKMMKYTDEHFKKLKLKYVQMLGGKCSICGYDKSVAALEFHHKERVNKGHRRHGAENPHSKQFDVSKVILMCANCHREAHWANSYSQT